MLDFTQLDLIKNAFQINLGIKPILPEDEKASILMFLNTKLELTDLI